MKTKLWLSLLSLLSLFSFPFSMYAQSYKQLWKELEKAEKADQPQAVIETADRILSKAEKAQDYPQKIKAFLYRMEARQRLSTDNFYVDMQYLEEMASAASDPVEKAILHSVLAEKYGLYANRNQWELTRLTPVAGEVPEDMRQWTTPAFLSRIDSHNRASLAERELLLSEKADRWRPIIIRGEASRYFYNDMYHLLGTRAIENYNVVSFLAASLSQPSDSKEEEIFKNPTGWMEQEQQPEGTFDFTGKTLELYRNMLAVYVEKRNPDAVVLLSLDLYGWVNRNLTGHDFFPAATLRPEETLYLKALDRMIGQYGEREVIAEAYLEKAGLLKQENQNLKALETLEEGIKRYPRYYRINALKAMQQEIVTPYLQVTINGNCYPGDSVPVRVSHRNTDSFTVKLHRLNATAGSIEPSTDLSKRAREKTIAYHFTLNRPAGYNVTDTLVYLTVPEQGIWLAEIASDPAGNDIPPKLLSVTTLKIAQRELPGKQYEFIVTDSKSGAPIEEARVILYSNEKGTRSELITLTTDKAGRVTYNGEKRVAYVRAEAEEDTYLQAQEVRVNGVFREQDGQKREHIQLLTDRTIYRPGQTVYLKGVAYEQQGDTAQVNVRQTYTVKLLDSNNREVQTRELTSNEYGSFTTTFNLPPSVMNGIFSIEVNRNRLWLRVEEYKRPTFTLTFEPQQESYRIGDRITVQGEATTYSGVPLSNTPLPFTIHRTARNWWGRIQESAVLLLNGETQTDSSGRFEITFELATANSYSPATGYYNFTVEATLTTPSGETQSASTTLYAGSRSLLLDTDLPYELLKYSLLTATFSASNLNGQPVATPITYQLLRKTEKEALFTDTVEANRPVSLSTWQALPSGTYILKLLATDDQGREADMERVIILYSLSDSRPPVDTPVWFKTIHTTFNRQSPATLLFGSSEKEVYLYYDLFSGNQRLESKLIELSDTILRLDYPYKEEYKEGLVVNFMFIKNGEMHFRSQEIRKSMEEKELVLQWEVFRDKLRPGATEEWRLTVKGPDGAAADAELLALMYDASLDRIAPYHQELKVNYYRPLPVTYWYTGYLPLLGYRMSFPSRPYSYPLLAYNRLGPEDGYRYGTRIRGLSRAAAIGPMVGSVAEMVDQAEPVPSAPTDAALRTYSANSKAENAENQPTDTAAGGSEETGLRSGFAETAFFYPQLRTNEHGEVVLSFTLPESLTRWNFRGYAHTKGMLTGSLTGSTVTSKMLMLSPNLPRYIRTGDETVLAASVSNRSEKEVAGTVTFRIFDPGTEQVLEEQQQPYRIAAGKTIAVQFRYRADDRYSLLGCRMVAAGEGFSDGEQHLLPVLSNKEYVTEALAVPLRGEEEKTLSLGQLFNGQRTSAEQRRLTVELAGNPVWYAIQALPVISNPVNDNAIEWASAWLANSLAQWVLNTTPGVKRLIGIWQQQGGSAETLWSNLQKNSELKGIILEETPWVLQANREEEQKRWLALLFDLNTLQNNNRAALNRLKELQFSGGGWPWYQAMRESGEVTQFVVESLVRLPLLTGEPLEEDALRMLNTALDYLRKAVNQAYLQMQEREKKGEKVTGIPYTTLFYLYLTAIAPITDENREDARIREYFIAKLPPSNLQMSIPEKALAAIVLDCAGRKKEADAFIASIREYLVTSPEMGSYFDTPFGVGRWTELKLPRHLKAMEAIRLVTADKELLEEMTVWLLKQKQAQAWSSSLTTIEAIYEIVAGSSASFTTGNQVTATIGKTEISTRDGDPGTGYILKSFTENQTVGQPNIRFRKEGPGIAWGAVYAQYLEYTDQIRPHGENLRITKQLYVESRKENRVELLPLNPGNSLKTGDKVTVRLGITTDRDLDFVQLKDSRAACFEPIEHLSGYRYGAGTGYYAEIKDASTHFFFDRLQKGVYVLEYSYRVNRPGNYSAGTATLQSSYAPEFNAHSDAIRVMVE